MLELAQRLDVLRPLLTAPYDVIELVADRAGSHGPHEPLALRLLALHQGDAQNTKPLARYDAVTTAYQLGFLPEPTDAVFRLD